MKNVSSVSRVGQKYGEWTILSILGRSKGITMAEAQCSCGNIRTVNLPNVVLGRCKSCGCKRVKFTNLDVPAEIVAEPVKAEVPYTPEQAKKETGNT